MADDDHFAQLMKGVAAWNAWRDENNVLHPILHGVDLHGADLSEADLSGASLSGANPNGRGTPPRGGPYRGTALPHGPQRGEPLRCHRIVLVCRDGAGDLGWNLALARCERRAVAHGTMTDGYVRHCGNAGTGFEDWSYKGG